MQKQIIELKEINSTLSTDAISNEIKSKKREESLVSVQVKLFSSQQNFQKSQSDIKELEEVICQLTKDLDKSNFELIVSNSNFAAFQDSTQKSITSVAVMRR